MSNPRRSRSCRSQQISVRTIATLIGALVLSGCGGSSPRATASGTSTSTATRITAAVRPTRTTQSSHKSGLAFAKCMRANGVSEFPDPSGRGGLTFSTSGIGSSTPAFHAAQAKCARLLPDGGLPGGSAHPSANTIAKLVKIATCMRKHSISQFPDPRTSRPTNPSPGEYQEITDYDGAILLFPRSINLQSPAYKQALRACDSPPLGLRH
jgi:hypothetical protein